MSIFHSHLTIGQLILLLAGIFIVGYMIFFKITRWLHPYNYEEESALLHEFLYEAEACESGFDTSSIGDFENWKKARKKKT